MKHKSLDAVLWASLSAALCIGYPPLAFWVSERLPYVHLLLVPGAHPQLPIATVILGTGVWFLNKHRALTPAVRVVAWTFGLGLAVWWVTVLGFWIFVRFRGGL